MSKKKKKGRAAIGPAGRPKGSSPFPRLGWPRSPVQRPHSTRKGGRGYDRKRSKDELRRERKSRDGQ